MEEKISLSWNVIKYDLNTINIDIENILKSRFKHGELEKTLDDLYDPYLLKDMDKAVDRIKKAFNNQERVIIFWDYDVDGVTSTSILMHFFKKIWMQVSYRLPDRKVDWYWLKKYFVDEVIKVDAKLLITVDCWIKDYEIVEYANEKWLDVIITDHHNVPEKIPNAIAVLNPKRSDCNYPFSWIAWVWVAFKLISALVVEFFPDENDRNKYLKETLDIVALWTVADCMELVDENRIIVKQWLKQIKNSRSKWIAKLIEDKLEYDLDADIFWFLIWPKINAAGRLSTPYKAVNLILNNWDNLDEILFEIEDLNTKRKIMSQNYFEKAIYEINETDNLLFYWDEEIEHWIIWIISWKITENYFKPSIVYKIEEDKIVASCRSPYYFDIHECLLKFKPYFMHFWGHAQAAGFSISLEKFGEFKTELLKEVNKEDYSHYKKYLTIDKVLDPIEFWFNLFDKVSYFKPFWSWNTKPVFMFNDFEYEKIDYLWKTLDHITIKNKYWINILWFWMGKYYDELIKSKKINIVFELMEDYWMGKRQLKAKIIDIFL